MGTCKTPILSSTTKILHVTRVSILYADFSRLLDVHSRNMSLKDLTVYKNDMSTKQFRTGLGSPEQQKEEVPLYKKHIPKDTRK